MRTEVGFLSLGWKERKVVFYGFFLIFSFLLGFEIKAMNMKRGVLKSQQLEILPSLVFAFWGPFLCEVFSRSNLNKAEIGA